MCMYSCVCLCLYVKCVFVCIHVCAFMCVRCVFVHVHVSVFMCVCVKCVLCIRVCIHAHKFMCVFMCVFMHVHSCVFQVYIFVYVCSCVFVCAFVYWIHMRVYLCMCIHVLCFRVCKCEHTCAKDTCGSENSLLCRCSPCVFVTESCWIALLMTGYGCTLPGLLLNAEITAVVISCLLLHRLWEFPQSSPLQGKHFYSGSHRLNPTELSTLSLLLTWYF